MFILKIIKNGSTEQSDFATNQEALDHLAIYKGMDEQIINHPEQIIPHEAIAEVVGQEASLEVLAILDASGAEISPYVPAKEFIQAVASVAAFDEVIPAWDEIIPANYTYSITEQAAPIADISPRQIRLALLSLGLTESIVDTAINNLESPIKEQAMIAWKYSTTFQRNVPIIETIGALLSLNSVQLDEIWIAASGV